MGPGEADRSARFGEVFGHRRGLRPDESAQHRPQLLDRGQRCDLCELHDFAPARMRVAPQNVCCCTVCFVDEYVECGDCGTIESREELALYEPELVHAAGFGLELAEPLCGRHMYDAYLDEWLDDHPRAGLPRALRELAPVRRGRRRPTTGS